MTDNTGSRRLQQTRMGMLTSATDPSQSVILLLSRSDPESPTARDWLDEITGVLNAAEKAEPSGPHYFLGGLPAVTHTADEVIKHSSIWVVLATLTSTFILLTWS